MTTRLSKPSSNDTERTYTVSDGNLIIDLGGGLLATYTLRTLDDLITEYLREVERFRFYKQCIVDASTEPKAVQA